MRWFVRSGISALALISLAAPAMAQIRADFTPQVGLIWPSRDLFSDSVTGCECRMSGRAETHFAIGAAATVWVLGNIGLETALAYSEPDFIELRRGDFINTASKTSARIFYASERIRGQYTIPRTSLTAGVAFGAGLVDHGGRYFNGWSGTTNFLLSGSADLHLALFRQVSLRTELSGYSYRSALRNGVSGYAATARRALDYALFFGVTGWFREH